MPTYEYACDACGFEFEREQRITENPIKTCPRCSERQARRLISATSFVLKGGGWYSDLYGNAKPAADKADAATTEKGANGADAKSKQATGAAGDGASESAGKAADSSAATKKSGGDSGSSTASTQKSAG